MSVFTAVPRSVTSLHFHARDARQRVDIVILEASS
jgi:hypothetical protein